MPEYEIYNGDIKKTLKMFRRDNVMLVFTILLAILLGFFAVVIATFYSKQQSTDKIQSGVYIKGINVSGLTKEEAVNLVNEELKKQMNDHIELTYKNHTYYVETEQIEAKFDIESSVDYAFNIAKTGKFIDDIEAYLNVLMANIDIEPVLVYNDDALTNYLYTIEAYLPDQLVEHGYYLEDDKLIVTNGINGAGIEIDELKKTIIEAIQDISYTKQYISIPTYTKYPKPIDIETIHNDVYREVQDAYYTIEPYAVFPDVKGVDFDQNALANMITENPEAEEYVTDLIYTDAQVTIKDFGMEAFPDLLASFSTRYVNNPDRTTNLRLAANKINGTVVLPGEIFSYNKVVGKRTIAAGYKNAAIYQDGQVTDGLGGGICQISTTLYNAAIEAGMLIEERRNHMFVPSYADAGKDATVVWGSTDFKFENRRSYPIKIEATVSGGIARIKIYGLKTDEEYDRYKLSIGSKTIKNTSSTLVVESYRIYKDENGNVVKQDKLYTDTYKKH